MDSTRAIRWSGTAIGLTTLYFAGWALFHPQSLGRAMGVSTQHAHLLGYRDLVSGTLLLTRPDATAFSLRAAADAMDVVTLSRTRPNVAVGAALFGAWSVAAGLAAHAERQRSEGVS